MSIREPQEFLDNVETELHKLSDSQRIVFGRLVCERYLPEYRSFSVQYGWGEPELLEEAVRFAESQRTERTGDRSQAEELLEKCVEATPDADDFDTVLVDYAQDAAIMVCHLIQYFLEWDVKSIASIASKARDLVDAKVQFEEKLNPSDPELEFRIASSPLMQAELASLDHLLTEASHSN
ncbi:MAG: DUF416 family protein [Acidobacteria bacterium]|nr:DUF416 family protein [Acidobacteriota bacterium]